MKKDIKKDEFLEHLKRVPIITVATEKSGISRQSIYRWRKEDKEFCKDMEKALKEGEDLINDLSESQLLTMIKEKNWPAIRFWLTRRNSKFKDKVKVTTKVDVNDEEISAEKQVVVRKALNLASIMLNVTNKQDEEANN